MHTAGPETGCRLVGLTKVGEYTIAREVGRGGMGKVFQALSPQGDTVALKTVIWPEGLDPRTRWETVERFQREARAARVLTHPNICQVLDIGADDDTFFIVMEFIDGQSVRDLIRIAGAIQVERAVEIMTTVCKALAYAHDQGIIHRDIKPDNIMVLRSGAVKLMDFGLASIVYEKAVTQTGTMMGTFCYMSPEQAQGKKADARSDIFSIGTTFYEMLAGRQAFPGESPAAVVNKILTEEPPRIPALPAPVSRTLAKCLRKQPQYRFQNAGEVISALGGQEMQPDTTETAVLPGRQPDPAVVLSSPAPRTLPYPPNAGSETEARRTSRPPDLRCSKCNEPMSRDTPSCWRCGTPNPVIATRTARRKYHDELGRALEDIHVKQRKNSWFKRAR